MPSRHHHIGGISRTLASLRRVQEHQTGDSISVPYYSFYLLIAVEVEEPELIIFGSCDGYLLEVTNQELVGLLELEWFVVIDFERKDLLLLSSVSIKDGEERLLIDNCKLVLLLADPGTTSRHYKMTALAASLESTDQSLRGVYDPELLFFSPQRQRNLPKAD